MCILCVVQKWSRRVATMLPWLVIPLIGLWALSQLLPPSLQFEITSPRLACVGVLLITLFWYEVLMPQLSMWRARRSARLRERQRLEAMELQKLRKSATRRCRNCHTPYRDQNPGGGRFMCSYCGHISKRPVLDIPGSPVSGIANSGFGKIWNGKVWLENGWGCGQDWSENANWTPSLGGKSMGKNGTGYFSGDDRCSAEKSYSGIIFYFCKLLSYFFLSIWWLWRKIIRVSSAQDGSSSDVENKGLMSKKGENGGNFHESRGEKARRKAEEKRQARLERELREEEERKQREEVARLVEEQRKLRDEKSEVDKECGKGLTMERERDNKRDAEKRRQERRKDRDRGSRLSSKSNSDGEELEKKGNKESERKREFDKRTDIERWDAQRTSAESVRAAGSDTGNAMKGTMNSFGRVSGSGSKYFDRMKGSFLSSSKAFNGTGFFGRGAQSAASAGMKVNKPTGFGEHVPASANRKELHSADHLVGRLPASGDNKITQSPSHQPVGSDLQPCSTVQKKSWQQLFTRSSATSSSLDANNTIYQQSRHHQLEFQNSLQPDPSLSGYFFDKQIHFGLPLPQSVGPMSGGSVSSSVSPVNEAVFPLAGGLAHDFMSEEGELFEDSCYAPDPVSLIGPVSESLDDLPLDLGSGFITNTGLDRSHVLKNMAASVDVSRPAPIESPFSRSRVAEERHLSSAQRQCTLKSADLHASPLDGSNNAAEQGTWQMWGTPLGHEGLGLVGGTSWLLPLGQNKPEQEEILNPLLQKAKISQHSTEKQVLQSTHTPLEVSVGGCQNGEDFNPLGHGSSNNDIWWGKTVFEPFSGDGGNPFPPLNMQKDLSLSEVNCDSPSKLAATHQFKPSPANYLPKTDWSVAEGEDNDGSATEAMPRIGGLFTTPNVQSLWSFN